MATGGGQGEAQASRMRFLACGSYFIDLLVLFAAPLTVIRQPPWRIPETVLVPPLKLYNSLTRNKVMSAHVSPHPNAVRSISQYNSLGIYMYMYAPTFSHVTFSPLGGVQAPGRPRGIVVQLWADSL